MIRNLFALRKAAEFLAAVPTFGVAALLTAFAAGGAPARVDFEKDVRPLLESRCRPCHFEGGKMYAKLPFDRSETITRLGPKLFTRIKKEEEQRLIREFLAQEAKPTARPRS